MGRPKQIWIERDDECPYFYVESELEDASPPLVRYVREDEIDCLRAENEALNERLHKIAASVNSMPTCKIAVDGVLWIPADRYNALIYVLRGEEE